VRKSTGEYPANWPEIARRVKDDARWKCARCGHVHDRTTGHVLTVHHLDMNPANCCWWNIVPLCQRCHLHIQSKVIMERPYMFEHSAWFKPYVAGYYAVRAGYPDAKDFVLENLERLLTITMRGDVVYSADIREER